jgi:NAD(P)-dependent dehydrogenase (short-subunit alcohol dehydrogenase family)
MTTPALQELLDFSGKVVLITGAGSGIGRAIALRCAQSGAAVCLHFRDSEEGARTAAESIVNSGGRAEIVRADLGLASAAQTVVDQTLSRLGALDVLINNAGSYPVSLLLELSSDQWRDVMAANLDSVHYCTQAAAHVMRQHGGGAVVNVASIEALSPARGHAHYTSAKAGVLMYTRTVACELGQYNIRVNAVSPGIDLERRSRRGVAQRGARLSQGCSAWTPGATRRCRRCLPLPRLARRALDYGCESRR